MEMEFDLIDPDLDLAALEQLPAEQGLTGGGGCDGHNTCQLTACYLSCLPESQIPTMTQLIMCG